jgi:hypothetical protein
MNNRPAWEDEQFAGSLIPGARPLPVKWIATDYDAVSTVEAMRAREDARIARLRAAQTQQDTPEAKEAEWESARRTARLEMRRERRQERIAAGIEPQPTMGDMQFIISVDPAEMERVRAAFAGVAKVFDQTLRPALEKFAAQMSGFSLLVAEAACRAQAEQAAKQQREMAMQQMLVGVLTPEQIRDGAKNLAAFVDSDRGQQWVDDAKRSLARVSSPPPRERYLPGTRHARKGQR